MVQRLSRKRVGSSESKWKISLFWDKDIVLSIWKHIAVS
nr:MAG TPA: hypothetical protein [Caudoviricetes sp.]